MNCGHQRLKASGDTLKVRFSACFKMAVASPEQRKQSPLPTVNERLGHLKPSRELLEYYRRKIAEYDGEYEEMVRKLELYKCTYEEQVISRTFRTIKTFQELNILLLLNIPYTLFVTGLSLNYV